MNLAKHSRAFGRAAILYSRYRFPYHSFLGRKLFRIIGSRKQDILDLGCGTGISTELLLKRSDHFIIGCDHDERMIREARRQARNKGLNIRYVVSPATDLPFRDGSFDVVTVGSAFHWFATSKTLSEVMRVLRPGGLVLIYWVLDSPVSPSSVLVPPSVFKSTGWEKMPWKYRDHAFVRKLLKRSGFSSVNWSVGRYRRCVTVRDYVRHLKTASSFLLLRHSARRSFDKSLRRHFYLQYSKRLCMKEELQVVVGKKAHA